MTVLITGASGGIGEELARIFAQHSHDLVLVARSEGKLKLLSEALEKEYNVQVHVMPADLTDPAAPGRLSEILARQNVTIDGLVNNAGFGRQGAFADIDPAGTADMIQLNIAALTQLTRLFLPGMLQRRHGKVLNVASTAGFIPGPLMAVYYASKAYVLSFSEALAEEVAGTGVSVTTLCPGPTETNFAATAGNQDSSLFRSGKVMDARTVAQIGYEGLMAGKRLVIAGWSNRLTVFSTRLAPREMLAKITKRLNT